MESTLAWIQASDLDLLPLWLQVCHCVHYRMHWEHQRAGKCRGIILVATDTWEWWEVMGLQSGERVLALAREGWSDEAVGSGPQMWLSGHSFTCNLQLFNASLSVLLWRSCNRYMKLLITDNLHRWLDSHQTQMQHNRTDRAWAWGPNSRAECQRCGQKVKWHREVKESQHGDFNTITLAKLWPYSSYCLSYLNIYKNRSSKGRGVVGGSMI